MKQNFILCFATCITVVMTLSCSKETNTTQQEDSSQACKLKLSQAIIEIKQQQTYEIPLTAKALSETSFKTYDWNTDIYELAVTWDDHELISVKGGVITSLGPIGETVVTITPKKGDPVKVKVVVVEKNHYIYDPDKPLTKDNIFLPLVCTKKWIQSFEFNSKGDVYILGTVKNDPWLYIFRYNLKGEKTGEMRLAYASHGTTCSLEEAADGDYIWLPTYGTKASSNEYKRDQLFSRVKFEDGKELLPEDEELQLNSYYMGDYDNFLPSIDFKNGHIGIRYLTLSNEEWVAIYNFKDIVNSPLKKITLKQSIKRGGESTGPIKTEETINMSFTAHDFSDATPIYRFMYNKKDAIGNSVVTGAGHAVQGFCIADGYAYITYGYPKNFDGGYSAYDYNGKQVVTRQLFTFLNDRTNLIKLNIAGTMFEPEGVRVKNGKMYLGAGVHFDYTEGSDGLETILVLPN